jgi:cobalt-precorrin 5A hydrolase
MNGRSMQVAVGLGCDRGTPLATVAHTLDAALTQAGLVRAQVAVLASIEAKRDEAAFIELAALGAWPLQFFSAATLAAVAVPNPSATVLRYMGTPSVSEAAALLAAQSMAAQAMPAQAVAAHLLVEKFKYQGADGRNATVSIASV